MTSNSAVNWLVSKAHSCSDGNFVLSRITIPAKMATDMRLYVESLDTELKVVEPRMLNWVESGHWFDVSFPQQKRRNSRARFENGRVEVHFEYGIYEN